MEHLTLITEFRSREAIVRRYEALEKMGFDKVDASCINRESGNLLKERRAAITVELCEMKKVHLEDLPNLRSFFSGYNLKWSSLEDVVLKNCPQVQKLGLGVIKESLLKSILITENEVQIDPHTKLAYLFQLLDDKFSLIIKYSLCNNKELDEILDNLQNSHFTNLQILRVNNCGGQALELFLTILSRRSHKLQVINIEECSLFYFCSYYKNARVEDHKIFIQLKELKLIKLDLHHFWINDSPTVIDLGNLQILHIIDVSSLYRIFDRYPAGKLHQLKELIIEKCRSLQYVWPDYYSMGGIQRTNFPSLSKLELKSLPNLRQIYSCHLEFPSLKYLMIAKCPNLEKFTTGFADPRGTLTTDGNSFFELDEIVFESYDNLVYVIYSETLEELRNLKKLVVSHCRRLKIVFNIRQEISFSTHLLEQLCELALIHLPQLTCIVNGKVSRFYQNLKVLQVKQCKSLNMLQVPLKLTNLEICDCEALDTIVISKEEEEDGIKEKLSFHDLKDVSLENLPSLSIIFPSISEFPSLQTLKIANCSTVISFIDDSRTLDELSTTNYLFPSSLLVENLKILYVISMNVEKLWHWNYPSKSFCELENLSLTNNNKLLSAISSSMITRFNNLRKLTLDRCELLTEVFDFEDDNLDHKIHEILPQLEVLTLINLIKLKYLWNKEPQVSFFSNLVSIYIFYCDNLQSLFSLSSIKNLAKLKILKLWKCDKIEEVISNDISEDENVSIIFPKLECLVMMDLPMLACFYKQSTTLSLPKLKSVRMSNIPKMKNFSTGILITSLLTSIYVTFVKKIWFGSLNNTISHMHDNPQEADVLERKLKISL